MYRNRLLIMNRIVYLCGIYLTVIFSNYSQTAKGRVKQTKIPIDNSVKIGQLSNGLTYYIKKNGTPENKVELRLVINSGSIVETDEQIGAAHFISHLGFRSSKNFRDHELINYLHSIGVNQEQHEMYQIGFDETIFKLSIPNINDTKLDKGILILKNWLNGALLKDVDVEKEKKIILEEYLFHQSADRRLLHKYLPTILQDSKYAKRLPLGTVENIKNLTPKNLRKFYSDWYRPDLAAVIVVGDIDKETAEKKIKHYFNNIPKPKNVKTRVNTKLKNHKQTFISIEEDREKEIGNVKLFYKDTEDAKPLKTIDGYRTLIIRKLITKMINNRLDELEYNEDLPFISIHCKHGKHYTRSKKSTFINTETTQEGQFVALQHLLNESERIKRYGFEKKELKRAKKTILTLMEKKFKERNKILSKKIVKNCISHFLYKNTFSSLDWRYKICTMFIPTISLKEVNSYIGNFLPDINRSVIITGNKKRVSNFQVINALNKVKQEKLKPYKYEEVKTSLLLDKKPVPGKIIKTTYDETLGTTTLFLSNGAKVIYKKTNFKNDIILFKGFGFGGESLYSEKELKKSFYAKSALFHSGINTHSKIELQKILSDKLVKVTPYINEISEGFNGHASAKYLKHLFQLTYLYATSLNKDQKVYKSYIKKLKSYSKSIIKNPYHYFNDKVSNFRNQNNRRHQPYPSKNEDIDRIDFDIAYQKYQERFSNAGNFNFYFVGNIDEEKLKKLSLKYIASLPTKNKRDNYIVHDNNPLEGTHKIRVRKNKEQKSKVSILYQGKTDYDERKALIFKIIGKILNIRCNEKLRQKKGEVYATYAASDFKKVPYGFYLLQVSFTCSPSKVSTLEEFCKKEVLSLMENNSDLKKDLIKVKKRLISQHQEHLKTNKYWLNLITNKDYENRKSFNPLLLEEKINSIHANDIQNVAKNFLNKGYILAVCDPE